MPFVLIIIGIIVVISAARGTHRELGELLKEDFTGQNNFFVWLVALGVVGAVGYYDKARPFSRAFLGLIIIAMMLSNRGFFQQLVAAFTGLEGASTGGTGKAGNTLDEAGAGGGAPDGGQGAQAPAKGGAGSALTAGSSLVQNVTNGLNGIMAAGGTRGQIAKAGSIVGSIVSSPLKAVGKLFGSIF